MPSSTPPTPRDFVTQLLNSLPSLPVHDTAANPLNDAPESVKQQLLSLQVLFPNEFLPALDLLDRKLITRFRIGIEEPASTASENGATATSSTHMQHNDSPNTSVHTDTVYYVRSAQQRSSRFSTSYDSTISYEVRLRAWNCTCPAFAFAAFPSIHPEPPSPTCAPHSAPTETTDLLGTDADAKGASMEWVFGGASLGEGMPPVCKHLLACVLAERCRDVFGECVEERRVAIETAAGWAAGWGDS
ncbi:hypothetical protein EJ07DRAFT_100613 [Lizonia empirigonia]|nr:hypothetical protein EJ07DRAFT_100613 [Lizonia empirigonia]